MNRFNSNPVSVIIPTYNRAKYVTQAIDSVLAQTYTNYEIIVVDDGSIDNTKEVLYDRYSDSVRYIYQSNNGPASARNKGIHAASYDLIAFLDSDDIWLPKKLEVQVPLMKNPIVILSYTNWMDSKNDSCYDYFSHIGLSFDKEQAILDYPLRMLVRQGGSGIWTSTTVCRKDFVKRVGGFDERMKIAEDIRLWFRLAMEGKFAVTSQQLTLRGWIASGEQLTQPDKFLYFKEHTNMRLEIFMESYARAVDSPPDVQQMLRDFIAKCLVDKALCFAMEQNYNVARRKAFESLVFFPRGKYAIKAFIGLICPRLFHILKKKLS